MFTHCKRYMPPHFSWMNSPFPAGESPFRLFRFCDPSRHADGACGTDESAEVAAHATLSIEVRLTQVGIEGDGLMATVLAGGVATAAADALLTVEGGIHDGVAAWVEPQSGDGFVVESYGANGACRVAFLAGLAARRIGAEQATRGLFLEVHSFVHRDFFRIFPTQKQKQFHIYKKSPLEFCYLFPFALLWDLHSI